jgi:hypothetical protein
VLATAPRGRRRREERRPGLGSRPCCAAPDASAGDLARGKTAANVGGTRGEGRETNVGVRAVGGDGGRGVMALACCGSWAIEAEPSCPARPAAAPGARVRPPRGHRSQAPKGRPRRCARRVNGSPHLPVRIDRHRNQIARLQRRLPERGQPRRPMPHEPDRRVPDDVTRVVDLQFVGAIDVHIKGPHRVARRPRGAWASRWALLARHMTFTRTCLRVKARPTSRCPPMLSSLLVAVSRGHWSDDVSGRELGHRGYTTIGDTTPPDGS